MVGGVVELVLKAWDIAHVCRMEAWVRERCLLVPLHLLQVGKLVPKAGKRECWPNPSPDASLGRPRWYLIWTAQYS